MSGCWTLLELKRTISDSEVAADLAVSRMKQSGDSCLVDGKLIRTTTPTAKAYDSLMMNLNLSGQRSWVAR